MATSLRALVVGGTSGIGQGVAQYLGAHNCHVTIVGRSKEHGDAIANHMREVSGNPNLEFKFLYCDAMKLNNIKNFTEEYKKNNEKLDILVLSQGIATVAGLTETSEGIEQKLAIHYYGRFAFVHHLLPLLRKSTQPRVLSVLSGGVHSAYSQYATDPDLKKNFSIKNAADAAGFYNDLAMDSFSRASENSNVAFIHSAPGFVNSNWGNEMPWYLKSLIRLIQPLGRSIESTGSMLSAPLLQRDLAPGLHIFNCDQPAKTTSLHTEEARLFMWNHTLEVLKNVTGSDSE